MLLLSLNLGRSELTEHTDVDYTGIRKQPVTGPVAVSAPGPKGIGASGLAGDSVCDLRNHGGNDQAVYAYAREDLDLWARELGRELPPGAFGENLTTRGLDVNGALIGERWRIGPDLLLEVTSPRTPCRTFAGFMAEQRWVKRFTQVALPGAYLRVIEPGEITAGDGIEIAYRPEHEVTVSFLFRALTTEPALLPRVLAAGEALHPEAYEKALRRTGANERLDTR
ncbi:MOSC domain-containing protein [Streptomyces zagrosensis]|uniref:MOSC domain-containing protein YiiM n=1 Tax=Streptomyces zagrosensis TaxID=1042984 RepID=A0A7W9QH73_9ACTN|nr:MOSC domain-containing protein [Streptomyces zagrosensis]MBB5939613.1 MOSC domain-containing protein YiiM [Streptomyces zagrosensis]